MFIFKLHTAVLGAICILAACNSKFNSDYEELLGPGWKCHSTPDEFKRAGVVVELTPDGSYFYYDEISSNYARVNGKLSLANLSVNYKFNVSGVKGFLAALGIEDTIVGVDLNVDSSYSASSNYGGTFRTALTGAAAVAAMRELSKTVPSGKSRYFLIRESIMAQSADIKIEKFYNIQIGSDIEDNSRPEASKGVSTSKVFDMPLGVCTASQEIGSYEVVEETVNIGLPQDAVIRQRK